MASMTHAEKVEHFHAEMTRRGYNRLATAPLVWRLAWKLGLEIPPPIFLGFVPLSLMTGIGFGVFWGLWMWFFLWRDQSWAFSAMAGITAGTLFGTCFAAYIRYFTAKFKLPPWRDYPNDRESSLPE